MDFELSKINNNFDWNIELKIMLLQNIFNILSKLNQLQK